MKINDFDYSLVYARLHIYYLCTLSSSSKVSYYFIFKLYGQIFQCSPKRSPPSQNIPVLPKIIKTTSLASLPTPTAWPACAEGPISVMIVTRLQLVNNSVVRYPLGKAYHVSCCSAHTSHLASSIVSILCVAFV